MKKTNTELNLEALKLINSENFNLQKTLDRYSKDMWESYYRIWEGLVDNKLEDFLDKNYHQWVISILMYILYKKLPENIVEVHAQIK